MKERQVRERQSYEFDLLDYWIPPKGIGVKPYAIGSVLTELHKRCGGGDGECYESQKKLSRKAKTPLRTFQRCIEVLEQLGIITTDRRCRSNHPDAKPINHHRIDWDVLLTFVPLEDQPAKPALPTRQNESTKPPKQSDQPAKTAKPTRQNESTNPPGWRTEHRENKKKQLITTTTTETGAVADDEVLELRSLLDAAGVERIREAVDAIQLRALSLPYVKAICDQKKDPRWTYRILKGDEDPPPSLDPVLWQNNREAKADKIRRQVRLDARKQDSEISHQRIMGIAFRRLDHAGLRDEATDDELRCHLEWIEYEANRENAGANASTKADAPEVNDVDKPTQRIVRPVFKRVPAKSAVVAKADNAKQLLAELNTDHLGAASQAEPLAAPELTREAIEQSIADTQDRRAANTVR